MNILKANFTKENPALQSFNVVLDQFLFSTPDAQVDRQLLQKLADSLINRHVSAEEACRALKVHIKEESQCSADHRIRALKVVEFLSMDCPSSVSMPVMQQLGSAKWKERLMKAALKSYSPPLQDALAQLLFKWASIHRKRDLGIIFSEMLKTLEAEGIIVEQSWKLGSRKPVVVAMLGSAGGAAAAASSSSSPDSIAQASPAITPKQYQEAQLVQQAESMTADANALSAACKSLGEAGLGGGAAATLRAEAVNLNARCTLYLTRLQEALARAHLSEVSIAHLCITADTIMEAQAAWQSINGPQQAETSGSTTAARNVGSEQPLASSRVPVTEMQDLLCLDDDDDGVATTVTATTPAPILPAPVTSPIVMPGAASTVAPSYSMSNSNPFAVAVDKAQLVVDNSPTGMSMPADALLGGGRLPEATLSAPVTVSQSPQFTAGLGAGFANAVSAEVEAELQSLRAQCQGLQMALDAEKSHHVASIASQQAYYEQHLAHANQYVQSLQERVRHLEMQLGGGMSPGHSLPSPVGAPAPVAPWVDF